MLTVSPMLAAIAFAAAGLADAQSNATIPAVSSSSAAPPACIDVARLDIKNSTIRTAQRTFSFYNGVAANYDDPAQAGAAPSQPDWKAEIEKDVVVRPAPNVVVRVLLIHDSHETGSGWRYFATGVRCSKGKLEEVFQRDGMSFSVEGVDSKNIRISLNAVSGKSTRTHWSYVWDVEKSKYALAFKP